MNSHGSPVCTKWNEACLLSLYNAHKIKFKKLKFERSRGTVTISSYLSTVKYTDQRTGSLRSLSMRLN